MYANAALPQIQYKSVLSQVQGTSAMKLPDGTVVHSDQRGKIVQANYSSGAKVKLNATFCLVQAADGSSWYGDHLGRWYVFD